MIDSEIKGSAFTPLRREAETSEPGDGFRYDYKWVKWEESLVKGDGRGMEEQDTGV